MCQSWRLLGGIVVMIAFIHPLPLSLPPQFLPVMEPLSNLFPTNVFKTHDSGLVPLGITSPWPQWLLRGERQPLEPEKAIPFPQQGLGWNHQKGSTLYGLQCRHWEDVSPGVSAAISDITRTTYLRRREFDEADWKGGEAASWHHCTCSSDLGTPGCRRQVLS